MVGVRPFASGGIPVDTYSLPSNYTPSEVVYSYLTVAGTHSMDTNGAGSSVTYTYTVPANREFNFQRMHLMVRDNGITPFKFGAINSLATGCRISIMDSDTTTELLSLDAGQPIQVNADWAPLAGVDVQIDAGAGGDAFYVRWTIAKAGHPIRLTAGQQVAMGIHDDVSGVDAMRAMVQGYYIKGAG